MLIEALEKLLNEFGPPFLPKGFVKVKTLDLYEFPAINVQIGDRDATILENGTITGAGTAVGENRNWIIHRVGKM